MLTWKCDICGAERPDNRISVSKNKTLLPGNTEIFVVENIKYCNDRGSCIRDAKTFTFLGNALHKGAL